jgi:hypothetical protein
MTGTFGVLSELARASGRVHGMAGPQQIINEILFCVRYGTL